MKKVLSLFSGAGGLDFGFFKAGYKIIGSAEIDENAVETHNKNFNLNSVPTNLVDENHYKKFIDKFKNKKIDLIIGGFPCQGYSLAGKRNLKDSRNQLYKVIPDIINELKVNFFVLENVPGILSIDNKREIKKIENYFNQKNLFFKYKILDTTFFEVPQKRKRVIFIGCNDKTKLNKIEYIFKKLSDIKKKIITVRDAIGDLENIKENKKINHIYTKHSYEMKKRISKIKTGESLYKNYSDGWKRINYDDFSPTVKENHGGVHIHPVKNRVLTPRELARLQTFPDDFIFLGSKTSQLIQIGNAVPVNFAKELGTKVFELFR